MHHFNLSGFLDMLSVLFFLDITCTSFLFNIFFLIYQTFVLHINYWGTVKIQDILLLCSFSWVKIVLIGEIENGLVCLFGCASTIGVYLEFKISFYYVHFLV